MSVISARVSSFALAAVPMMLRASACACSIDAMKAPEPTLTSMTNASSPAAIFFDRIEAVISGIDSTVPVTSRIA